LASGSLRRASELPQYLAQYLGITWAGPTAPAWEITFFLKELSVIKRLAIMSGWSFWRSEASKIQPENSDATLGLTPKPLTKRLLSWLTKASLVGIVIILGSWSGSLW
tara:strand:+ start:2239 stop:2562 length:324 start_codon:yes stop_codon:yes gene_type:complete